MMATIQVTDGDRVYKGVLFDRDGHAQESFEYVDTACGDVINPNWPALTKEEVEKLFGTAFDGSCLKLPLVKAMKMDLTVLLPKGFRHSSVYFLERGRVSYVSMEGGFWVYSGNTNMEAIQRGYERRCDNPQPLTPFFPPCRVAAFTPQ